MNVARWRVGLKGFVRPLSVSLPERAKDFGKECVKEKREEARGKAERDYVSRDGKATQINRRGSMVEQQYMNPLISVFY